MEIKVYGMFVVNQLTVLVEFVLVIQSLSIETYTAKTIHNSGSFFIIITLSPASALHWLFSVNLLG